MGLLFTDTTYDITVGLLNDEFKWEEVRTQTGQKASIVLQAQAHAICAAHQIHPRELKGLITLSGPGFYTGLRLSEGLADVFKFFNVPCYSFYSYEIPHILGHAKGVWMTKAYRGEYFFHHWDEAGHENLLVPTKEVPSYISKFEHVFIHSRGALDIEPNSWTSTLELLMSSPEKILPEVAASKMQRESFYFRAPEDEFRVST